MKKWLRLLLYLVVIHAGPTAGAQLKTHQNPIRKVVKMLQLMMKKVTEEGEKQASLFTKYICYCKTTAAGFTKSVQAAKERLPQLQSTLKECSALHQQLTEDVKLHQTDRKEAEETLSTATAIRAKDEATHNKEMAEQMANVKALGQAIQAVEKGLGDFLQTGSADVLRRLTVSDAARDMNAGDRDVLSAFLTQQADAEDDESEPKSGEIMGILKQMSDAMSKDLNEGMSQDEAGKANFESLVQAKQKEIAAATKAIEEKMGRVGDLAVEKTQLQNDIEDAQEGLDEDSRVLADLSKACQDKKGMWTQYEKVMGQEKLALADAVKLLNDDDAADLFKKTLPSASSAIQTEALSFLQVRDTPESPPATKRKALNVLRHKSKDHRFSFLVLAMRGKKVGSAEVIKMIDNLVVLLREEQSGDDNKKDNCESEIDRLEDQIKAFRRNTADIDTSTAETRDSDKDTTAQIVAMVKGIEELDQQVAIATDLRKEESAETNEVLAENNAAKSLLELAKNRLAKFYNPKQASALQREKGKQPGKIDQGPDLKFKTQGGGGAVGMINTLLAELGTQSVETETSDKLAQQDYQEFLKNSAEKRAMDSKAITDKESAKAEYEMTLHQLKASKKVQQDNLFSAEKEKRILHQDCDWLMKKYELRKEARTDEIDSLQKAKAVLSGANFT